MTSVCPYCRSPFDGPPFECPGCGAPHHAECFEENGGCTVFGCTAAPAVEAKISVAATELEPPPVTTPPTPIVLAPSPWLGANSVLGPISSAATSTPVTAGMETAVPAPSRTPPPPPAMRTGNAPPPRPPGAVTGMLPNIANLVPIPPPKKRVRFVLLAIFLGMFGAHNFYAGYVKKAFIQICFSLLTCFYGAIVSWVWAIIEACMINVDADGEQFT